MNHESSEDKDFLAEKATSEQEDDELAEAQTELLAEDEALQAALKASSERQEELHTWIVVTDTDGLVRKRIVSEGSGPVPELHSTCMVHYVGKLKGSNTLFMDTRNEGRGEPKMLVAGREHVLRERCLHMTAATMRVGERCVMETGPEHGYGKVGNFSFPSVPPNAALVYELELIAAEPPSEKPTSRMFYEERLEAAQRRRKAANLKFQDGLYQEALSAYLFALACVDEDFLIQLEGFHLEQAHAVKAPVLLNMAACQLQLQDWNTAADNCSEVLKLAPASAVDMRSKALFRRARAREHLGQTDEALRDLLAALQLTPNNTAALSSLHRLRGVRRDELKAVDALFKNQFKAPQHEKGHDSDASASTSAPAHAGRRDSTMDAPSAGERVFNWIADHIVNLLSGLAYRLFGVRMSKWERYAAAKPVAR